MKPRAVVLDRRRLRVDAPADRFGQAVLGIPSLASYWPLDTRVDGLGKALDLKSGFNASKAGGITLGGVTPGPLASNPAQPATDFDGVDDFLDVGNQAAHEFSGTASFSFMAWARSDIAQDSAIVSKYTGGAGYEAILATAATRLGVRRLGSAAPFLSSTPVVDTWYLIVGTYDGTNFRYYLNGALSAGPTADGNIAASGAALNLGRRSSGGATFFNGKMAHVAIFNAVLSATDVSNIYAAR